jgi:hypothetical protein
MLLRFSNGKSQYAYQERKLLLNTQSSQFSTTQYTEDCSLKQAVSCSTLTLKDKYEQLKNKLAPLQVESTEVDQLFSSLPLTVQQSTQQDMNIMKKQEKLPRPTKRFSSEKFRKCDRCTTAYVQTNTDIHEAVTHQKIGLEIAPAKTKNISQDKTFDRTKLSSLEVLASSRDHRTRSKLLGLPTDLRNNSTNCTTKNDVVQCNYNRMTFRSKRNKQALFDNIEKVLQRQQTNVTTNEVIKYSDIVRKHAPNVIVPSILQKVSLYNSKYNKKKEKSKNRKRRTKLSTKGSPTKRIIIQSNNDVNCNSTELIKHMKMTNTNEKASEGWQTVQKTKKDKPTESLPKTQLKPKLLHPAATPPKHSYCISLGITPPTEDDIAVIITPQLISKVIASMQHVCPKTRLKPIDDEYEIQSDPNKLFEMNDDTIKRYVYVYDTNSDSYRCSFQISTDSTINDFKLNKTFLQWLKQEKITIERTYLLGQPSVRLGFMVNVSTRGDIVDLLDTRIRSTFKPHLKWQFDTQTAWIRTNNDISTKVVMFRTPKLIENEMIKEFHRRFNGGRGIQFYPWTEFLDLSESQKESVIKSHVKHQEQFRTLTFSGFHDFAHSVTVFENANNVSETSKRKFLPNDNECTDIDTSEVYRSPDAPETMTVLDAIRTQFINHKGEHLFHTVYSPVNGIIECTTFKHTFFQAKKISNDRFLNSLANIIPAERHSIIFKDKVTPDVTDIPSKLMENNISSWMKKTVDSDAIAVQNYTPTTKRRMQKKLLVFQDSEEHASLQTPTKNHQEQPSTPKNQAPKSIPIATNMDTNTKAIHDLFDSLNKKIDNRFTVIEKRQHEDRMEITSLKENYKTLDKKISSNIDTINSLEETLVNTIDSAVKGHLRAYAASFEEKIIATVENTTIALQNRNEGDIATFRREHHDFVLEYRAAQKEQKKINNDLKAMIRNIIIGQTDSEIIFSNDQNSDNTNEENTDVSFEHFQE